VTDRESPYTAAVRISLSSDQRLKVMPTLADGGVSYDTPTLYFKKKKLFVIKTSENVHDTTFICWISPDLHLI